MQKSWVNGMHLKGAQMVKYDIQRLEMLQEVNTNAYVLGRDVRSPDESPVFRTTLLRYRVETTGMVPLHDSLLADEEIETNSNLRATDFVIGTQSLNPANNSGAKLLPETCWHRIVGATSVDRAGILHRNSVRVRPRHWRRQVRASAVVR